MPVRPGVFPSFPPSAFAVAEGCVIKSSPLPASLSQPTPVDSCSRRGVAEARAVLSHQLRSFGIKIWPEPVGEVNPQHRWAELGAWGFWCPDSSGSCFSCGSCSSEAVGKFETVVIYLPQIVALFHRTHRNLETLLACHEIFKKRLGEMHFRPAPP